MKHRTSDNLYPQTYNRRRSTFPIGNPNANPWNAEFVHEFPFCVHVSRRLGTSLNSATRLACAAYGALSQPRVGSAELIVCPGQQSWRPEAYAFGPPSLTGILEWQSLGDWLRWQSWAAAMLGRVSRRRRAVGRAIRSPPPHAIPRFLLSHWVSNAKGRQVVLKFALSQLL